MADDQTVTGASSGSDAGSADASPSSEDERIKGFQRALNQKAQEAKEAREAAAALQARIEALELAQMPEAERLSVLSEKEKARLRALEAENERLKLAQKFPKVAPHFETIYAAKSAEEQMAYLNALLNPQASQQDAGAPSFPEVEPNNPMRPPSEGISVPPNSILTEAQADAVLKAWGNRPMRSR